MDEGYVEVARITDFDDDPMKVVDLGGREVLIAKTEGNYYATSNRCPHMGGNLSYGSLDGTTLKCYAHGRRFDLRDGSPVSHGLGRLVGGHGLTTYGIRIAGDRVLVSPEPYGSGHHATKSSP